jgi:hypothetical protein
LTKNNFFKESKCLCLQEALMPLDYAIKYVQVGAKHDFQSGQAFNAVDSEGVGRLRKRPADVVSLVA